MKTFLLVSVTALFLLSLALAVYAYTADKGLHRAMLEFLLGTWPNQTYDVPSQAFSSKPALAVGVGIRSLVLFGLVIIGAAIALLLAQVERRLRMRFEDYITARDQFFHTEVYAQLRDPAKKGPIAEEKLDEMIKTAFDRGQTVWQEAQAEVISKALASLKLPEARRR